MASLPVGSAAVGVTVRSHTSSRWRSAPVKGWYLPRHLHLSQRSCQRGPQSHPDLQEAHLGTQFASWPAAGEEPVCRAKARTQRASRCPDLGQELRGLRGSGLLGRLSADSVGCAARCCPRRGLRGPPAGVLLQIAGFFCDGLCSNPHLSRRAPPYN
jgi:hypothetical protein